jgi:hypothetical protein
MDGTAHQPALENHSVNTSQYTNEVSAWSFAFIKEDPFHCVFVAKEKLLQHSEHYNQPCLESWLL